MNYKIVNGSVSYGAETILEEINFEIKEKDKIAIVGRNGCGKSTLLNAIIDNSMFEEGIGEEKFNIYRYVIYLGIIVILVLIDIFILRKKAENSYAVENLLLCMLLLGFTYEITTFLTITYTLICIVIQLLLNKLDSRKNKTVKKEQKTSKIPIGFYLCMTNIICLIITNFYIFYKL